MKKLVFALAILILATLPVQTTSAHVLITDDSRSKGAILHIIPGDDPIAGEEATLFFDMQDELPGTENYVILTVDNPDGEQYSIQADLEGTLATASYVFPDQGAYELTYTVVSDGEAYKFNHSQRVTRGNSTSPLSNQTYAWAEILLLTSGLGIVILAIFVFNRRQEISSYSTF